MASSPPTGVQEQPLTGTIGAVVSGVDLREPLGPELADTVRTLAAKYGVLFFRGQELDVAQHVAVGRSLGRVLTNELVPEKADPDHPEVGVISTDNGVAYQAAVWHSDVTWGEKPPAYSILHMRHAPPVGGDTMWSSQVAAYRSLSPRLREFLVGLTARHESSGRTAQHPVVCRHPVSGQRALFVNRRFTTRILELAPEESDAVLDVLFTASVRPELTCRWRWEVGDLAIWDNPFVQHFAIHDYGGSARRIHRIEVEGSPMLPAA